ncbi:MAG: metallo-mystery pair system four-Cys motif protein [Myxococcales bacterium]|nr:metallo-mystery pair system four-Cys motif protein [Myxococcales bacterium]
MTRWPLLFALLGACASEDAGEPVELRFAALVGDEPFACGARYEGVGAEGGALTPTDLRFFVHDVRLVDADGAEVPVTLERDGRWQSARVALLDFEDGCGDAGNADLNDRVRGRAPAGAYTGVRFRVGVPTPENHGHPPAAAAPLNLTALWWSWNAGYKFLRIDGRSDALDGWRLHLGASGCTGDMRGDATCTASNRPEVSIDDFDLTEDVIAFDLGALLAGSSLDRTGGAPGCLSDPNDADCAPFFEALGLPFGDQGAGRQRVFRAR